MKRQHSLRSLFVFTPAIGARCHGLIIPHAATTPLGGHDAHQPKMGALLKILRGTRTTRT